MKLYGSFKKNDIVTIDITGRAILLLVVLSTITRPNPYTHHTNVHTITEPQREREKRHFLLDCHFKLLGLSEKAVSTQKEILQIVQRCVPAMKRGREVHAHQWNNHTHTLFMYVKEA